MMIQSMPATPITSDAIICPPPSMPVWTPIPGVYSPPCCVPGMKCTLLWMREDVPHHAMGLFIGAKGVHFKNITALSGAAYLFLRNQDGRFFVEIWGYPGTEFTAMNTLCYHWNYNVLPFVV